MKLKLLVGIPIVLLIMIVCILWCNYSTYTTFTQESWNENVFKREKMIDDLLEKYSLQEMDYAQITSLLGTNGIVPDSKIRYYVGKSYIGPVLFSISFDENNKVASYGIMID